MFADKNEREIVESAVARDRPELGKATTLITKQRGQQCAHYAADASRQSIDASWR